MTRFLNRAFAWAGGALFVGALALTSWAYAFWFGQRRNWGGWIPVVLDTLLFTLFATHHSLFARSFIKSALRAVVPERQWRSVYVWLASLLLMVVCLLWQPIGGEVYAHSSTAGRVAHSMAQLTGVWLIARSVSAINALELAGIRGPSPSGAGSLHVTGPYRLVRHPLYLGWVLIVFGASHLTGDRMVFAIVTTSYLVVAIPWEERLLRDVFGDQYERYTQHVRWRLVPFVY